MPCPFTSLFKKTTSSNTSTNAHNSQRRKLLQRIGSIGGAVALTSSLTNNATASIPALKSTDYQHINPDMYTSKHMRQPFYGKYQSGIVNPAPASGALVAFDVLATDKHELERLFKILTQRVAFLTTGGKPAVTGIKFPPLDSGILGEHIHPDNLTVTVAVGNSLFDERFGLTAIKPKHLQTMARSPNDALRTATCHGDLVLQFCANSPETVLHALRDIIKHTPALLSVRWRKDGYISSHTAATQGKETPVNLLGFKDGTANPSVDNPQSIKNIALVAPHHQEPKWAEEGSYLAIRLIRFKVEHWDRTPLQEQQQIFGRNRSTGAPLGMHHEHDTPNYQDDRAGKVIPLGAHIRLANPREHGFEKHHMLRRGYSYSDGTSKSGQLDMGLLFIAYQANLVDGFITVQKRLDGEGLEEYVKPFGGGFYFALPGVQTSTDFYGKAMLAAASA